MDKKWSFLSPIFSRPRVGGERPSQPVGWSSFGFSAIAWPDQPPRRLCRKYCGGRTTNFRQGIRRNRIQTNVGGHEGSSYNTSLSLSWSTQSIPKSCKGQSQRLLSQDFWCVTGDRPPSWWWVVFRPVYPAINGPMLCLLCLAPCLLVWCPSGLNSWSSSIPIAYQ